jgi:segregation and condensation protein A
LLEYKKFKEAAQELGARENLWREVFVRQGKGAWEDSEEPQDETLFNFGLLDLLDAFKRVLANVPADRFHEIGGERISLADRINQILERLQGEDSITFESLFEGLKTRDQVVVSFLALLELARLRAIKVLQVEEFGTIRIMKAVTGDGVE